ncbi:MAG: hypothetical protein WCR72_02220 [Bacteroidota bacterium]
MKNEDFDEAVREKLESLNQTYTENEIDKVYHQVMRKRRFPWKGINGSWLFYSLSAAAFTVLTFWTVAHFRSESTDDHRKESKTQPSVTINADTLIEEAKKPDTAHFSSSVPKTELPSEIRNEQRDVPGSVKNSQAQNPKISGNFPAKKEQKATKGADSMAEKSALASNPGQNQAILPRFDSVSNNSKITAVSNTLQGQQVLSHLDTTNNNVMLPPSTKADHVQAASAGLDIPENAPGKAVAVSLNSASTKADIVHPAKEQPASLVPEADKPIDSKNIKEIQSTEKVTEPLKNEALLNGDQPMSKIKTSPNIFKDAGAGLAANFRLSGQSIGMGLSTELILKNHLSLGAGLNYGFLKTENFTDKADLFEHKHHNFNHRIEDHLAGKEHITEVSINNRLLQLPITLGYSFPLKMNFSLTLAAGTNLDLYIHQNISYVDRADSNHMNKNNFGTRGDVTTFNNIEFSAGLAKRWKPLLLEVRPFYSQQLKQVFYKPKDTEFGIGISIHYYFGQ